MYIKFATQIGSVVMHQQMGLPPPLFIHLDVYANVSISMRGKPCMYVRFDQKLECAVFYRAKKPCGYMNTFSWDGMATVSRLLKIIGLFCKRAIQKRRYSAKETYDFEEPTNRVRDFVACYG